MVSAGFRSAAALARSARRSADRGRVTFVFFGQLRWGHREAATPLFHLLIAVFFSGFRFVQTLQRAVMTFVQLRDFSVGNRA